MDKSAIKPLSCLNTPCVGICSTVYGDEVCRGCKRFYREIIQWNSLSDASQIEIVQRLSRLMSQTVRRFVQVTNPELVQDQLARYHIRHQLTDDAYCFAHHLLRFLQDKPALTPPLGISKKPAYHDKSWSELFKLLDQALFQVATHDYHQQLTTNHQQETT